MLCAGPSARPAVAAAGDIFAQLFPLTGEVRLVNKDAAPIPFVFYSITSAGDALDGSNEVWQSIADNYDVSGNGLIDANNEWFELAGDSDELTEGVFSGPGGNLPPLRAISLGNIWDPFAVPFPDLVFDIWNGSEPIPVTVELALDGDYSTNQIVDQADYVLWRRYVASTMLLVDGDLSGDVDEGDYLVWRENFGLSLPLPPYVAEGGGSRSPSAMVNGIVPEPASAMLVALAFGWLIMFARRCARFECYCTRSSTAC
jgi:hypothetical protein